MATYIELYGIRDDAELTNRVKVCVIVAAHAISSEVTPVQLRLDWAKEALENPTKAARQALWFVLAANKTATTTAILTGTDSALQAAVDDAVDLISGAAAT